MKKIVLTLSLLLFIGISATMAQVSVFQYIAPVEVSIYPNPATNYFKVSTDTEIGQITMYNIIGRKVKEFTTFEERQKETKYDIENLPEGMYLIQIADTEGLIIATRRLSKRTP